MMTLVCGHYAHGSWIDFPHRCPGIGCAIAAYVLRQAQRRETEIAE